MRHLDDIEIVDGLDGSLAAERAAHLDVCESCRDRLSSLRQMAAVARPSAEDDVPEPSPLFWEHFSRRVHEAVSDIDRPSAWSQLASPRVSGVGHRCRCGRDWQLRLLWNQRDSQRAAADGFCLDNRRRQPRADLDWNVDDDEEWALVRVVADDLHWEDAQDAGLHARPGSAERVALEMSADERQELARLIEFEMKRPGSLRTSSRETSMLTLLLITLTLAQAPAPAAPQTAERPEGRANRPAGLTNGELINMLDTYAIVRAQEALQIPDEQYGQFVTRLKQLQRIRRQNMQKRNQIVQDLRRLTQETTVDENALRTRLKALARP